MKAKYICIPILFSVSLLACNKVTLPENEKVLISNFEVLDKYHTDIQRSFITSDNPDEVVDSSISYGRTSNSIPEPVHFSWEEENDQNIKADKYEIRIAENQDMNNYLSYTTKESSVDIYNLKLNTEYYYSVSAIYYSNRYSSDIKTFNISDKTPRNIYIDGVENVRDLGGWDIGENKTYKQGLIYRTAQFNYGGANTYKSAPSEKGMETIKKELKIKTDIDLRRTVAFDNYDEVNGITSSPLGVDVKYVSCPMIYGTTNIFANEKNKASIQLFFSTLSDINNYPVAFHCLRGTDRTGALAYILGALVGMNEKDLMMDYLFSDLANIGTPVREETISGDDFYIQGITNSSGETYSQKAKNYIMTTCNISESIINQVIDNLTD